MSQQAAPTHIEEEDNDRRAEHILIDEEESDEECYAAAASSDAEDDDRVCGCLFCDAAFSPADEASSSRSSSSSSSSSSSAISSAARCVGHMAEAHGFDLAAVAREWKLTTYHLVRMINFLRTHGRKLGSWSATGVSRTHPLFEDEAFLIPVIPDDPLITDFALGLIDEGEDENSINGQQDVTVVEGGCGEEGAPVIRETSGTTSSQQSEVAILRQKLEQLERAYSTLKQASQRLLEDEKPLESDSEKDSSSDDEEVGEETRKEEGKTTKYFLSYTRLAIHSEMLHDTVRTSSYRDFFEKNPQLVRGKVVVDVGAGSGILSLFAARAGAAHVIAVEASRVARYARESVQRNGFSEVVDVVCCKAEDSERLGSALHGAKADIVVSEWMGYFLLFENMLPAVLAVRDSHMNPSGTVQPSHTGIILSAFTMPERWEYERPFWKDVYGFDMSHIGESYVREALVEVVAPQGEITDPCTLGVIDINAVKSDTFKSGWSLKYPFRLIIRRTTTPEPDPSTPASPETETDPSVASLFSSESTTPSNSEPNPVDSPTTIITQSPTTTPKTTTTTTETIPEATTTATATPTPTSTSTSTTAAGCDCHALVGWFDVEFRTGCVEPIVKFGTGPSDPETHWRQTVFMLPRPVESLAPGDALDGTLTIQHSAVEQHDIEVLIDFAVQRIRSPASSSSSSVSCPEKVSLLYYV
ncbi:S-adenosyl-L-methionine-dependent methyltransferase [Pelomyxa schiedti]|nr:S-adenosyl-L-methionine-dependent methyltransferase [Pelomyxa schiedti]